MKHINCVEVDRDALESAGLMAECMRSTVAILREALENGGSNIDTDVKNVCWLLDYVMEEHTAILEKAAVGELTGPTASEAGGAA